MWINPHVFITFIIIVISFFWLNWKKSNISCIKFLSITVSKFPITPFRLYCPISCSKINLLHLFILCFILLAVSPDVFWGIDLSQLPIYAFILYFFSKSPINPIISSKSSCLWEINTVVFLEPSKLYFGVISYTDSVKLSTL